MVLKSQAYKNSAECKLCYSLYTGVFGFRYTDSEGLNKTAHPHSLIKAFAVRKQNNWILWNVSMESKGPDKTARMRRIIWMRSLRMFEDTFSLDAAHVLCSRLYLSSGILLLSFLCILMLIIFVVIIALWSPVIWLPTFCFLFLLWC